MPSLHSLTLEWDFIFWSLLATLDGCEYWEGWQLPLSQPLGFWTNYLRTMMTWLHNINDSCKSHLTIVHAILHKVVGRVARVLSLYLKISQPLFHNLFYQKISLHLMNLFCNLHKATPANSHLSKKIRWEKIFFHSKTSSLVIHWIQYVHLGVQVLSSFFFSFLIVVFNFCI